MATTNKPAVRSASKAAKTNEIRYSWEGKDKSGKVIKGEIRAAGTAVAPTHRARRG